MNQTVSLKNNVSPAVAVEFGRESLCYSSHKCLFITAQGESRGERASNSLAGEMPPAFSHSSVLPLEITVGVVARCARTRETHVTPRTETGGQT